MTQQFIHSLSHFAADQIEQYGSIGIVEIVLSERMYNKVFFEMSKMTSPSGYPPPYSDYFTWNFTHDHIQIRKFGTKDKDFHHTGIESGIGQ
jgi:hypothetical protein